MPEIPTAADKLAAIDLVRELAERRWDNGYGTDGLARLRSDAEQQLVEDRSIGGTLIHLEGYPDIVPERVGALVRAAVESTGGRLVFADAEGHEDAPTAHTAPGVDAQDRTSDPGGDVYDEIRAVRGNRMSHLLNHSVTGLETAAMRWLGPEREGGDRRANLVMAAALLITAIEVMDRA